jgi:hypothetical protein
VDPNLYATTLIAISRALDATGPGHWVAYIQVGLLLRMQRRGLNLPGRPWGTEQVNALSVPASHDDKL